MNESACLRGWGCDTLPGSRKINKNLKSETTRADDETSAKSVRVKSKPSSEEEEEAKYKKKLVKVVGSRERVRDEIHEVL